MCKDGHVQEAYDLAIADYQASPQDVWVQREVGWALYYLIKADVDERNYDSILSRLDELKSLPLLDVTNDALIFDNILFKIGDFVRNKMAQNDIDSPAKLSTLYSKLKEYDFMPSKGYSFLLSNYLKYDGWGEMADFLDWWNLDKLTQDDYTPFVNQKGQKMMTLAERAYIANAKALLRLNDLGRIEEFLPKLDNLMTTHPEMTYPGYFYGKLLLSLGEDMNEALQVIVPFARKKASEFWVWQLLSDVFVTNQETQLACLLRAVNCRTQENFLGKVRIKLAQLYIQQGDYNRARYHIDCVTRCYASYGWRLPYEIDVWIHQPWINTTQPDSSSPLDYKQITDEILCAGTEEAIAIVTYVDGNSHKATLIYGWEKRMVQKIRFKVGPGVVLKINYIRDANGKEKILNAGQAKFPTDLNYAKVVEGNVDKRPANPFAFLRSNDADCFIAPQTVKKYGLQGGETVKSLVVYDYNKGKEKWNWVCVSIKK